MEKRDELYYELKRLYNKFSIKKIKKMPNAKHIKDIDQEIEVWTLELANDIIRRDLKFPEEKYLYSFLKNALINKIN